MSLPITQSSRGRTAKQNKIGATQIQVCCGNCTEPHMLQSIKTGILSPTAYRCGPVSSVTNSRAAGLSMSLWQHCSLKGSTAADSTRLAPAVHVQFRSQPLIGLCKACTVTEHYVQDLTRRVCLQPAPAAFEKKGFKLELNVTYMPLRSSLGIVWNRQQPHEVTKAFRSEAVC